ncbi:MAG: branched-chain amino acid transport system ATP-binding protein [Acidimicrobiaceae bacterium]|jgi:branched-chain amino acid transport system ATP-binding protein
MTAALTVEDVTVRFGGNVALSRVSLRADAGVVTGLIGPNGAGKTTLFNVVTGLQNPTTGSVHLGDRDVTRVAPHKRARAGLSRTFQRLELFSLLSVRSNVRVAADLHRSYTRDRSIDPDAVAEEVLERLGIGALAESRVDRLPTGLARLVEVGRALATRPRVLLLDEPASGQDESETAALARLLRDLASDGMAIVLVEHDVDLVMETCERIHVLDFGEMLAVGTASEIQSNPAVLAAYLGVDK